MHGKAWRRGAACAGLAVGLALSGAAHAADPTYSFNVAAQPLRTGLITLAMQSRISISTGAAAACAPNGHAVAGRFTLRQALERMLAGSGCSFRILDGQAVEVVRLPTAPAPPAKAARDTTPITAPLAELVVVATQRATPADQLAYAVSAYPGDSLTRQGLRDSGDLAAVAPSMTVTNLGAGRDKILLRGLSDGPLTGRTQSMVGIYLDDTRLTYNAPDPDLLLIDMAQVEVLRGPQGALYGSGSLGGVVHLMTQRPDPRQFAAWVSVIVGATSGGQSSEGLSGMINLPLMAGKAAARLVLYGDRQGGYIDDVGLGLRDINATSRNGARLSLRLDLDDHWTLNGGFTSQAINAADTQYAGAGSPAYTRRGAVREPHDNDFSETHVGLLGDLDGMSVRWSLSTVQHGVSSRYDATSAPPVALPPGPVAFDDADAIRAVVMEGSLSSAPQARVQWLAGGFLARTRQNIDLGLSQLDQGRLPALNEIRRDRLDEAAVFGEVALPVNSTLTATLGGRLFSSSNRVSSQTGGWAGPPRAFKGRQARAGFAPKAVLAYSPTPDLLIYGQAAEGYRAGGFNTSGPPGQTFGTDGVSGPQRRYGADELWSFEAGGKLTLLDGRARLRTAIFQARWKNIQSDLLLPSGLPFTGNIGDGKNLGWETEAALQSGSLQLGANFLLNQPELENPNPAFAARGDLGLAGVPRYSGGVTAHYNSRLTGDLRLQLDGRYNWVGPSRLTFDAVTAPRMGDYATARVAAALVAQRWSLTAAIDNPSGSDGDTFAYGNPFMLRSIKPVTPLRPRTATVTVRASF